MSKYLERIIRKSKLAYRSTEGFRPRIKIAYLPPLPVYAIGRNEVLEIYIDSSLSEETILNRLKESSGELNILKVLICNETKSLNKDIKSIKYNLNTIVNKDIRESIGKVLRKNDEIFYLDNKAELIIDFKDRGPEQFSKIYKLIDPEKINTKMITRNEIVF